MIGIPKSTQTLNFYRATFSCVYSFFFFSTSIYYVPDMFQALCLGREYIVSKSQILGIPIRDAFILLYYILRTYYYKVMKEREQYYRKLKIFKLLIFTSAVTNLF